MIRKAFYIRKDQDQFLLALSGSEAEHVRRAIDQYIERVKRESVSVSPSQKGPHGNQPSH